MAKYRYGMRLRGYSIGCQPRGVIDREDDPSGKYYDIIIYDRKLTKREVEGYELDYLGEESILKDIDLRRETPSMTKFNATQIDEETCEFVFEYDNGLKVVVPECIVKPSLQGFDEIDDSKPIILTVSVNKNKTVVEVHNEE